MTDPTPAPARPRSARRRNRRRSALAGTCAVLALTGGGAVAWARLAPTPPASATVEAVSADIPLPATDTADAPDAWHAAAPAPRTTFSFRTIDDAKDITFNQLLGINNHGRIVGYFGSGADAAHPNKGYRIVAPYTQRQFADLNVPGSLQTQAVGVNNDGVIVGFSVDGRGANVGFVARNGNFTPVANPATPAAAPFNQLLGVNDRGVAAGFYNDAGGHAHGYTVDTRTGQFRPVELPVPAESVTATGIDNEGDVSGFYTNGGRTSGFAIVGGKFQRLSFGSGANTQALGINHRHQVVGSYVDAKGVTHGFLWSPGSKPVTVDAPAATSTVVNGLNDNGQLVGFYQSADGNTHGFLATRRGGPGGPR